MAAANVRVNQILLRRGNTAAASTYTGPAGEVIVDTGLNTLRVQNGVTAGGTILATNAQVWSLSNSISTITGVDTSLLSNAATQQTQINTINANIGSYQIYANTAITALLSNAATQAQAIANAGGIYGNANVQTYLGSFDGNILPAANVTYSLGDATHQWKELWVSNNTIYIGGTPIRVVGGTLLVNNAPVSGAYGNTQVADYLLGNISTGNITPTSDVMVVGTGDAKLTLDSFNQAALLQAKKTFNRSFGAGEGSSFVYSNVAGTGSITATITNDLYLKTLLERLSSQFSTPTPAFTYSYSNVRVQIYDVTNANVTANVTGVDNYGNPDEYTLLIDQPPTPDPFSVVALDISYDYLNTVGVDVDKDLFGITTDNDDIDIKSGRDIDLQARDDFYVSAGSEFIMRLNANDGQNPTNGIILETQANGTTRSWAYRFDGATEFPSGLTAEPLSNYVPAPGTIIQQTAGELLQVLSSGEGAGMTVGWTDIPTSPSDLAVLSFNNVYGQVQVTTGNYATTTHTWSFTDSGNIIIPGNINYANGTSILSGLGGGSDIGNLQIDNNTNQLSFGPGESYSFLYMKNDGSETRLANDNGNVQISTIKQGPGGGTYFWTFDDTGNILLPNNSSSINYANGVSILSGIGGSGNYGDANVTALLASNISLIGSSSNITLATLGAGSTTTVSQEGGNPGINGQQTISAQLAYNPGMDLIQPGWTVTGNNITVTTTVTDVVETAPGFFDITTDTAEFQPFWYQDVYTFTSNTPGYSNLTVSSGNIIGGTSQINFVANSSGDGYGFSTIELRPDTNAYDDSYLIIDPTYPSHIHIRAGGTQDNSLTQLFLGGENSHFRVDSGLNPTVYVRSNNNDWIFGTDGNLSFPTGGSLIFDSSATSTIDGVTNIAASGTIGANVIQVLSDLTSFGASPAPVIYGFRSISTTGSAVNEGNISASGNLVASRDAYVTGNIFAASYNFANGVNILDTISGVTSISSVVNTSILSDVSGDYQYGTLDYSYAVNGNNGQFAIQYSFPLVYGNVDVNVGNVIASNVTTTNGIFWANGQAYSTGGGSYGNTEVAAYLPSYAGNLAASRAQVTNAVDFMYGGYPYMGWQLSGSDTLKLRTNIASGDYTHDAIIVDRQSLAVNVVAQLTAASVSTGNITITGNAVQQSAYYETYANVVNSGGNLTCNFVNGGTFYATLTGNVTANFTNVAVTTGTIVGATIIVDQGVTPYQVTNVQVNGGSVQQVRWAGGTGINVGTGSNTDVMSFSLINLGGGAWRVLGQIANYG